MYEAPWSLLRPSSHVPPPESLTLELLNSASIEQQAAGQVTGPETLNHRTLKPEPGGLFCAEIFGAVPTDNPATLFSFAEQHEPFDPPPRARHRAYIELAAPVLHPLYRQPERELLAEQLGLDPEAFEQVLRGEAFVLIDPGPSEHEPGEIFEDEHNWPEGATVDTGSFALAQLFEEAWGEGPMFLQRLPVLPPDLRPLIPLDKGRLATSDLNELYQRVVHRNARTTRLLELNAPPVILRNERRILQQAVDSLFLNNGQNPTLGANKRRLQSLWDLAGLDLSPWQRLSEMQPRIHREGAALRETPSGPEHWFLEHLHAMGLAIHATDL